jgi:excisionase family DNA binding protein
MGQPLIGKRALPLKEFCSAMGFSYDTGLRAVRAGSLRSVRVGKRILIPVEETERVAKEGLRTQRRNLARSFERHSGNPPSAGMSAPVPVAY